MSADFGHDVGAHVRWRPAVFNEEVHAAWRRGEVLSSVTFARHARVGILNGRFKRQVGVVMALVAREPRVRYRVRTGRGKETGARQDWLDAAG